MRFIIHVCFWVLIWLWMTTVYIYETEDFQGFLLFNLIRLPLVIAATYATTHFVVYRNLVASPPRYVRAALLFTAIFIAASVLDRFISGLEIRIPTLKGEPLDYAFINPFAIFKNSFLLLSILGLASAVQFFNYSIQQQKRIHDLEEEKLRSELGFLRSQVNPHFLFNVFNNLFSMASRHGHNELAKGLAGVAGLMRYLTYESNVPLVPLHKEVQLLQSFIELQRLRITEADDVLIDFKVEGDLSGQTIAPVLLLPLLENAFKHSLNPGKPSVIQVRLTVESDQLLFIVNNKISNSQTETKGGVGLQNLRQRLEKIYPNSHQLEISLENDFFNARLSINLIADNKPKVIL